MITFRLFVKHIGVPLFAALVIAYVIGVVFGEESMMAAGMLVGGFAIIWGSIRFYEEYNNVWRR